jgi:hypothetical protein
MSKEKAIPNPIKQKIDFALAADAALAALRFQENEDCNIPGKKSSLTNSFGDNYSISTMAVTPLKSAFTKLDLNYFAKDENANLVGMKHVFLELEENSQLFLTCGGGIATLVSSKQIALGLEILNMTILQNYADYTQIPIQLSMPDYNLQRIKNIRSSLHNDPTNEELLENLRHTQAQRINWKKIYGNNGALGLTNGIKLITPDSSQAEHYVSDQEFLETNYHIALSKQRRNTITWSIKENMSLDKESENKEQLIEDLSLAKQILKDNNIL